MKKFMGRVISDKMIKAAIVQIEWKYHHPLYGKIINRKKKIHAGNEIGAKFGQFVEIKEVRPIAKTISYKITKIIQEKGKEKPSLSRQSAEIRPSARGSQPLARQSQPSARRSRRGKQ